MAKSKSQTGKVDIIVGLQYGGEGKNKIAEYISGKYDLLAPSGYTPLHPHDNGLNKLMYLPTCAIGFTGAIVIGNNNIVSPITLKKDMDTISKADNNTMLIISAKTPLCIPTNKMVEDSYRNNNLRKFPNYEQNGSYSASIDAIEGMRLTVADAFSDDLPLKYNAILNKHMSDISAVDHEFNPESRMISINEKTGEYILASEWLKTQQAGNIEIIINQILSNGCKILALCPNGTMNDSILGEKPGYSYPTRTTADAVISNLGIMPKYVKKVIGVFKGYTTIHTDAQYIGEINGKDLHILQATGNEYVGDNACRCGWTDLIQLKYACLVNGVTELAITKIDVICNLDVVKAVVGYKKSDGSIVSEANSKTDYTPCTVEFAGCRAMIQAGAKYKNLPDGIKKYIEYVEAFTGIPVKIISYGQSRKQTMTK